MDVAQNSFQYSTKSHIISSIIIILKRQYQCWYFIKRLATQLIVSRSSSAIQNTIMYKKKKKNKWIMSHFEIMLSLDAHIAIIIITAGWYYVWTSVSVIVSATSTPDSDMVSLLTITSSLPISTIKASDRCKWLSWTVVLLSRVDLWRVSGLQSDIHLLFHSLFLQRESDYSWIPLKSPSGPF